MNVDEITYQNLIILLLQFLEEENYRESLHSLEQESKVFFNVDYFGECIINGEWEKAEKYLAAFTKLDDNVYSRKLFFELLKQKYFEVLERDDDPEAVNILWKDLNIFSVFQGIHDELAKLSPSNSIRVNGQLFALMDTPSARIKLQNDLKVLLKLNPKLQHKLVFPRLEKSGLLSLIKLICPSPESKMRNEELIYLILQFLEEEKFNETAHILEQESKIYFNMDSFEQHVTNGEWDKAEKYLSAFTDMSDVECLMNMFLELQKQKYFEALNSGANFLQALKSIVDKNATLREKLKFPDMDKSRLITIIKQCMDWWVPRFAKVRNETISFESIPKVSNLFHIESPVISEYHDQGVLPDQSGYESRDLTCSAMDKSTICELMGIIEPSECCTPMLPDNSLEETVFRLIYSYSGDSISALTDDATLQLWAWQNDQHSSEKANASIQPQVYQLSSGLTMNNETGRLSGNPCLALYGPYLLAASGGKMSIFNLDTFEKLATFTEEPPQRSTYFIFLNQNTFAIGFHDSSILIHCFLPKKNIARLEGHQRQITCLAFSQELNVLVSSGADAQLCVWNANGWQKQSSKFLQSLCTGVPDSPLVKQIQFHPDQIRLLVVGESQIDVYEAPLLDHLIQWITQDSDGPITSATYSCNGESIYVCCRSGCIKVLVSKTLQVRLRIKLTPPAQTTACVQVYPLVIAAHPNNPNQVAVGVSNGRVYVLEPLHSGEWRATLLKDGQGLKHQQL